MTANQLARAVFEICVVTVLIVGVAACVGSVMG